ncbi:hypothetical protein LIER_06138 [Lithospermum erythrorhizon]|uniref:Uncharacterized protein n=1 Tax=Lithospermum erythrorhizon TaxID=34254 RepID=A0AAV3P3F7_LITER
MTMEYALKFSFEATNNEGEYEAMIAGLIMSQRAHNEETDRLSQLATTYYHELPKEVYTELRDHPAYEEKGLYTVLEKLDDWRTHIARYLATRQLPDDKAEAKKTHHKSYKLHT